MKIQTPLMALFLLGNSACNTQVDIKPVDEASVQEPLRLIMEASIDRNTALAGDILHYTLEVHDQAGNPITENLTWTLRSDIESDLHSTTSTLMPVVAGTHKITVQALYIPTEEDFVNDEDQDGIIVEQTIALEVSPLNVEFIDLQLDKRVVQAGENVPYRAWPLDRFGNRVQDSEIENAIEFIADDTDLTIASSQVYSVVADIYGITAWYGDISDTEYLEVLPDDADRITLVVPNGEIEKYDSIQCDVIVEDRFGNILDNEWLLEVESLGQSVVSHDIVTFLDEGYFTLYASTFKEDGTELMDSYGPILIDSSGPLLVITTPERGAWTELDNVTVAGTVIEEYSVLNALLIDGTVVQPDSAGNFSSVVDLNEGLNLLETEAIDSDGNISNDSRSILSGNFEPKDEGIDDSISAYLGASGINSLEDNIEDIIGGINLASVMPANPVATQSFGWCDVTINIYNFSYGAPSLDIDPQSNGYIKLTMTMPNLSMDVQVIMSRQHWYDPPCPDFSGNVSASSIQALIQLYPYVSGHQIFASLASTSSSINGLNVSLNGWGSILNFLINLFEGTIADMLEGEVANVLSTEAPPLMRDVLRSIALETSFDLMGTTFFLDALPSSISVDNSGIGFGLQTNVYSDTWVMPTDGLGSFAQGYAHPYFAPSSGYNVAISTDVVNQLLYQVWGSGFISQELSLSELGVQANDIEVLFPNSSDLRVTIEPLLPPVVRYNLGDLELQMGDLYIAVHNGAYSNNDIRLEIYAHVFAPIEMSVSSYSILATVGDPNTFFDVVYPLEGAGGTESLLQAIMPLLLPAFTDAISEIPLPSFDGVTLSNVSSSVSSGHLKVTGTVSF